MNVRRATGAVVALMVLLALAVLLQPVPTQAQPAASNQVTVSVLRATYITTGTTNAAATSDFAQFSGWGEVDIFVTADVSGTATLTATAQVSADGVNWTNADYEYWTGSAIGTQTFQRVLSADGTEFMSVPAAGQFWRVNLAVTGGVTTTVNATLRR